MGPKVREITEEILNYDIKTLQEILLEIDNRIDWDLYRERSAEAKIERVDPDSMEFEEAVALIAQAKDDIKKLAPKRNAVFLVLTKKMCFGE